MENAEKRMSQMMWIMGIILTIILGTGGIMVINSGVTKKTAEDNAKNILHLQQTSVNYVYIEYLVESNQKLMKIAMATPGSPEMSKAIQEWGEFQDAILKRANPTRSVPAEPKDISLVECEQLRNIAKR